MISIEKLSRETSVSNYPRKLCRIIPAIIALALFGVMSDTYAQQKEDLAHVYGIPVSFKAAAKTDDKKKDDSPALSEREKTLLDRIEQLERRLAEVESRLAEKSPGEKSQPAGTTTAGAFRPAEPPALNTTAAAPRTDVSESSQGPTEPAAAISPKFGAVSASQNMEKREPFAFADFTWLSGNPRTTESPIKIGEVFTGEFRADVAYHHDFNHPMACHCSLSTKTFPKSPPRFRRRLCYGWAHPKPDELFIFSFPDGL
ncbi:MAG TPA: hypothetical protein VJ810_16685 [Blastocatellia bacterium]|nr:hypothetical protein [Blastocatellia bacterium]